MERDWRDFGIAELHPTGSTPAVVATILSERILR